MEKSDHVWMSHMAVCLSDCPSVRLSGQEWIAFITSGFVFYQASQYKRHFCQGNCLYQMMCVISAVPNCSLFVLMA